MSTRPLTFALLVSGLSGCADPQIVYDAPDGRAWGAACTGWSPPDGGVAFVTNSMMNSVAVLDLAARETVATHPVGVTPLAENGPHHLAIDLAQGVLYTPLSYPVTGLSSGPHAEHGSSVVPGTFIKRALCDFRLLGSVDVDPNPGDMLLTRDGQRAYVTHYDLNRALANPGNRAAQLSNLVVIDTRTMTRAATVPLCVAGHGMAFSPDERTLYVACAGDDAIAVVDLTTSPPAPRLIPIRSTLAGGSPQYGPYAIGVAADGRTVWLGCTEGRPAPLLAFDTATAQFDARRIFTRLPGRAMFPAFTPDGTMMLVPTQAADGLVLMSTTAPLQVLGQLAIRADDCVAPHQVSRGPDGLYYLVCEGRHGADPAQRTAGSVLAVSLNPLDHTMTVAARYPAGIYPDAIVFAGGPR